MATDGERREILKAWRLTLKARAARPQRRSKPDAETKTELLLWIDAWCSAHERRDVDVLVRFREVEPAAAGTLRRALAARSALRLDCTDPSIAVRGDRASVSFERTDRWSDLTAVRKQFRHPRIERQLRRTARGWVVSAKPAAASDEPQAHAAEKER